MDTNLLIATTLDQGVIYQKEVQPALQFHSLWLNLYWDFNIFLIIIVL